MPIAASPPLTQAKTDGITAVLNEGTVVLGIESSCDETAAAVLRRGAGGKVELLSSIIASQDEEHAKFGGVVPEIAARAHMKKIDDIIEQALTKSGLDYTDLNAVAATAGPGLIGGVIAGLMAAKGLSMALDIPLIAVNHLEGHALSPRLASACPFPYLLLLVSGGHSQLLSVKGLGDYERLGSTVDDAAGEAFDKSAKVMGLGFPGGPNLERAAKMGNPEAVSLPRPFARTDHANFSFAGLKTAVARAWEKSDKSKEAQADLAASFQKAVCDVLSDRTQNAMDMFVKSAGPSDAPHRFVVAGGVASNASIRTALTELCTQNGFELIAPPLEFCTDNAAMIALAGAERLHTGERSALSVKARPRWPLDSESAIQNPMSGSGKKGAKS
jgi:N6-L-threonylcarbamoyladenine synthase